MSYCVFGAQASLHGNPVCLTKCTDTGEFQSEALTSEQDVKIETTEIRPIRKLLRYAQKFKYPGQILDFYGHFSKNMDATFFTLG